MKNKQLPTITNVEATHYGIMLSGIQNKSSGATRTLRRMFQELGHVGDNTEITFQFNIETVINYAVEIFDIKSDAAAIEHLQLCMLGWAENRYFDLTAGGYTETVNLTYRQINLCEDAASVFYVPVFSLTIPKLEDILADDFVYVKKQRLAEMMGEFCWLFRHGIDSPMNNHFEVTDNTRLNYKELMKTGNISDEFRNISVETDVRLVINHY